MTADNASAASSGTPTGSGPAITAVLVTYRSGATIGAALDGLAEMQARGLLETIVVDNDSSDGCLDLVRQNYPEVRALSSGGNVGFGRGNNLGLRLATTPYVLFLNPDAVIAPGDLQHMLEVLEANPKVGILGPAIRNNGTADQITCRFPTPSSTLGDALGSFGGWKNRQSVIEIGSAPRAVDWVCGAVLLVRRDLLQQLNGFDPRFFLYFEETDLCKRALALGFETWTTGQAVADHLPGTSARASADDDGLFRGCIAEHYFRSRYYYLRKHHGRLAAITTDTVELMLLGVRWLGRRLRLRPRTGEMWLRLRSPFWHAPEPPTWTDVESSPTSVADQAITAGTSSPRAKVLAD